MSCILFVFTTYTGKTIAPTVFVELNLRFELHEYAVEVCGSAVPGINQPRGWLIKNGFPCVCFEVLIGLLVH